MIAPAGMEAAIDQVSALLAERIGLRSEPTLRGRLRRCIREQVNAYDDDLHAYVRTLSGSSEVLQTLVNRVTVQETGFFRHPDHFAVLAASVLPDVEQPVTIWSAGCANGQEAYSLAMVLEEQGVAGSVVATDLSTDALARTAAARYTSRETDGISPARRLRHLVQDEDGWQVNPTTRARVTIQRHNLVDSLPSQVRGCQVVFCRNVLIYFSAEHARSFFERLADAVAPEAYLFLGSAESLWQVTDRFQAARLGDSYVHRRSERVGRRPPPLETAAKRAAVPASNRRVGRSDRPLSGRRPVRPRPAEGFPPARLAVSGQAALAEGDHAAAVVAFRKWVYLAPEDPLATLHLGLALEAGGDALAARRAFGVSRGALLRVGSGAAEASLKGFSVEELLRLLDSKQGEFG